MTDWESICRCCGLCCHEKIVTEDFLLIDPGKPCEYLDEGTALCTVYKNRFRKSRRCRKVTPIMAALSHSLPSDCAYVEFMKRHHMRLAKDLPFILSSIENAE